MIITPTSANTASHILAKHRGVVDASISYPGHQHPSAIRATRNSLLRQANTYQATSQFLHQFAVFPNIIPAGLTALAVAKVSLKGANLFLGKYSKKLLIHIGGQNKSRFVRNKRLQFQIGLPSRGFPHEADILTVIPPLFPIAGKAMVESSRACANKRIEIAEHLRYLPMGWFNDNSLGEVTSGIIAAMMFLFDWRMGLITLTGLVLFFAVNAAMQRAEQALSQRKFNADERLVSKVLEYVQGIAEVKNFDLTHDSATKVHGAVEEARKASFTMELPSVLYMLQGGVVQHSAGNGPHRLEAHLLLWQLIGDIALAPLAGSVQKAAPQHPAHISADIVCRGFFPGKGSGHSRFLSVVIIAESVADIMDGFLV